jgi:hypothetical protein
VGVLPKSFLNAIQSRIQVNTAYSLNLLCCCLGVNHCLWSCNECTAFYYLSKEKCRIVDALTSTVRTKVNWSEMEAVIENVDRLDSLVREHNAGVFPQGTVLPLLYTLIWTNYDNEKKHLVITTCLLCTISSFIC